MGKLSLRLAFAAAGLNYLALKLGEVFDVETPLLYVVSLCLPAVALGSCSWCAVRSFAKSWPVVLCTLIAWAGMLYAFEIEKNRGLVAVSYLTMVLPLAALIVEHRCWWLCARIYVLCNVGALAAALWFEYQAYGINILSATHRFGFLMSETTHIKLANPNVVGGQLAFAAVLAFMLYLRAGMRGNRQAGEVAGGGRFGLAWTVFLSLGCVLTASRGAFVAWLGGMLPLLLWGTRSLESRKLRDLVAIFGILAALMLFAVVMTDVRPWDTLQARFDSEENVWTASGRVRIWRHAFQAWLSNPRWTLVGTGTGVAPEGLGDYLRMTKADGVTPGAVDCHNAFVEWMLSFGLLGLAAGICLLLAVGRQARWLDRRDGTADRQAMLLCLGLASMTYVTFYQLFFVAAGALIVASLSEPAPAVQSAHNGRGVASGLPPAAFPSASPNSPPRPAMARQALCLRRAS